MWTNVHVYCKLQEKKEKKVIIKHLNYIVFFTNHNSSDRPTGPWWAQKHFLRRNHESSMSTVFHFFYVRNQLGSLARHLIILNNDVWTFHVTSIFIFFFLGEIHSVVSNNVIVIVHLHIKNKIKLIYSIYHVKIILNILKNYQL